MKFRKITLMILLLVSTRTVWAETSQYQYTNELSPNDYLFGSYGRKNDPIFDNQRVIDLDIDLGIGSDCGKIDFRNTLRASLSNIFDKKYMEGMFNNILGASPMLLTCYLSPTWCSILKQAQLKANFLANMRMDQCALVDKYVDSRVEDYYQERQQCVRQAIARNGGNGEAALEQCKNYWDVNLSSWSGDGKKGNSKLLEDSAKWAGFTGGQADKVVSLVREFVGDTIVTKGKVSVDFGPRRVQLTPRTHLLSLERATFSHLCGNVVQKVRQSGRASNVDKVVSKEDLMKLNGDSSDQLVDRATIRSLAFMPYEARMKACRKLSDAISMSVFAREMNQSLDFLTKVSQNPHLPDQRRQEIDRKRRALKDQVQMTVTLKQQNSEPLNKVLAQINKEGQKYQGIAVSQQLEQDERGYQEQRNESIYMDCADGIMCSY